jgi:hypothetical protein
MIEARLSAFHMVQQTHKNFALLSITQRVVTVSRMIFFDFSIFYRYVRIPVELILFIAGCFHVATRRDLLLMVVFIFLVIVPILIMPYFTPRYLYWISPFIYIVAGLSINVFRGFWARGNLLKGNKVWRIVSFKEQV